MKKYIYVIAYTLFAFQVVAQVKKNHGTDVSKIKTPVINFVKPDTTLLFEEEEAPFDKPQGIQKKENKQFVEPNPNEGIPYKSLEITQEDTTVYDEFDEDIVEVTEEIRIDSVWIKIAEHFAIWDSKKVDPYGFSPDEFKDTIDFVLYDSVPGRGWSMPIYNTKVNDNFGPRKYRWHYGTDLDLDIGIPVRAAWDGVVRISKKDPRGYGNYVLIRHYNGLETLYGHFKRNDVDVGEEVKAGQQIGLGGNSGRSTGPHLHFEVRYYGNAFDSEHIFDYKNEYIKNRVFTLTPSHYAYAKQVRMMMFHKVKSGETLYRISRKYGTTPQRIAKLNKIKVSTPLRVGQRLRVR